MLYVSPLKALNNDIQRNLLNPLGELHRVFSAEGILTAPIRVLTRSGDTPAADRRRMLIDPPEILITTPESLNLLLSSKNGRRMLTGVTFVILDEIHAVVSSKRGVHLITAVERLAALAGEFQRIALSATVRPARDRGCFRGRVPSRRATHGARATSPGRSGPCSPRPGKATNCGSAFPAGRRRRRSSRTSGSPMSRKSGVSLRATAPRSSSPTAADCAKNSPTGSTRATAEPLAYSHHGSLAREIRLEVERRLKNGDLRAIVATHTLELGIDIGALDEVVLLESPASVASAVQRIGRGGHRVGDVSRAVFFPTHPPDLLCSAVLTRAVLEHDIEPARPVTRPLDVLAQIIVSMAGSGPLPAEYVLALVRTSYPYRDLTRREFDLVLDMLTGRYADSRIRELKPRLLFDRLSNTLSARKGALQTLYISGGTIPDRGYFLLRHHETGARIGELDEEFVWEASIGQVFTLGTQNWKIERITHSDVLVRPAPSQGNAPPFWKGERNLRDFHLSASIGRFLENASDRLEDPAFRAQLQSEHCLDEQAADGLLAFLRAQQQATGCPLPHRHHLLLEFLQSAPYGYPGLQVVLHTIWGGRVNRPFALALDAAWEQRFGQRLEVFTSDDCLALQLPAAAGAEEILALVTSRNVEQLLRNRLETSGFFGARFRESAARALLLPRRRLQERMPLWLSRLRSKQLLESVRRYEDFPILLETWRTCFQDEFDMEALLRLLSELESGVISWSETRTGRPSPMAQGLSWPLVNHYMYQDDSPPDSQVSRLRPDLIREVALSPDLRPALPAGLITAYELKRRRLSPGYPPDTPEELLQWVKERVLMPESEWQELLGAVGKDRRLEPTELVRPVAAKLVRLRPSSAAEPLIAALESLPRILSAFYPGGTAVSGLKSGKPAALPDPAPPSSDGAAEELTAELLGEWLQFYGPRSRRFVQRALGLAGERLEGALQDLLDSETLIAGHLVKGSDRVLLCDRANFESLLRLARAGARPDFEPLEPEWLPPFLARFQGVGRPAEGAPGLLQALVRLTAYPAPAAAWESEILPARTRSYDPAWLDTLMREAGLRWMGFERKRLCFCCEPDLELLAEAPAQGDPAAVPSAAGLFPHPAGRYDFSTLLRLSGLAPKELSAALWKAVWSGEVTNDSFAALRRGLETRFRIPDGPPPADGRKAARGSRAGGRAAFSRWKGSLPYIGNWHLAAPPAGEDDPLAAEERNKDRARILLDRYGIVFRELIEVELPAFRWRFVFRALRLMELAGEVLAGYFFHGLPGPQFMSREAFRSLQQPPQGEAVFWISAVDPASLCGTGLEAFRHRLPRRLAGNHVLYRGREIVFVSQRNARELLFHVRPDDRDLPLFLGFFHHLLERPFQPLRRVVIETINGQAAPRSPFAGIFEGSFEISRDPRRIVLYRARI